MNTLAHESVASVPRPSWRDAVLHRLLMLLAAAAAGLGAAEYRLAPLRADLERRPPVAIIEVSALRPAPGATEPTATVQALRFATRRLAAAGYVVLDGQAVLAAPSDLYVPPQAWAPEPAPAASPGDTPDAH
jgi:hypothetical protein